VLGNQRKVPTRRGIPQGDMREDVFREVLVEDSAATGAVFAEWKKRL
jgi:hypothetical protein